MAADPLLPFDARLYRAALQLCPGEFRREHGGEMTCDYDEARSEVAGAVWTFRLQMGVDLARTIVVQWLRTGLPAIACVALVVSLVLVAGFASVARRVTVHIPVDAVDSEALGVVLLAAIAVMVIVVTIVFNLWVHRPRRVGRR